MATPNLTPTADSNVVKTTASGAVETKADQAGNSAVPSVSSSVATQDNKRSQDKTVNTVQETKTKGEGNVVTFPLIAYTMPLEIQKRFRTQIQLTQELLSRDVTKLRKTAEEFLRGLQIANRHINCATVSTQIKEIEKLISLMDQQAKLAEEKLAMAKKLLSSINMHLTKDEENIPIFEQQAELHCRMIRPIVQVIQKICRPADPLQEPSRTLAQYTTDNPVQDGFAVLAAEIFAWAMDPQVDKTEYRLFQEQLLKFASELNNPAALLNLGKFYERTGRERDALACYQRSAEAGNPEAMYRAGRAYFKGIGVEEDHKKAADFFENAVQDPHNMHEPALISYGDCLFHGVGRKRNHQNAFKLYTQAQEANIEIARVKLALCYKQGPGVQQDVKWAVELLKTTKKSDSTAAEAYAELGVCYLEGNGFKANRDAAAGMFLSAYHYLGVMKLSSDKAWDVLDYDKQFMRKEGPSLSRRHPLAALQRAANLGMKKALETLGEYYESDPYYSIDSHEVDPDYARAVLHLAAERDILGCASRLFFHLLKKHSNESEDMFGTYIRMLIILQALKGPRFEADFFLDNKSYNEHPESLKRDLAALAASIPDLPQVLNLETAIEYLNKRASANDGAASSALGFAHQYALASENPNLEMAFHFYLQALQQGHFYCLERFWSYVRQVPALKNLATLLFEKCKQWLTLAEEQYHHSVFLDSADPLSTKQTVLQDVDQSDLIHPDAAQACVNSGRMLRRRLRDAARLSADMRATPGQFQNVKEAARHYDLALSYDPLDIGLENRCQVFGKQLIHIALEESSPLTQALWDLVAEYALPGTKIENPRLQDSFWPSDNEQFIQQLMDIDRKMVAAHQAELIQKARESSVQLNQVTVSQSSSAKPFLLSSGRAEKERQERLACMRVINGIAQLANSLVETPGYLSNAMKDRDFKLSFEARVNIIRAAHARAVAANAALKNFENQQSLNSMQNAQKQAALKILRGSRQTVEIAYEPIDKMRKKAMDHSVQTRQKIDGPQTSLVLGSFHATWSPDDQDNAVMQQFPSHWVYEEMINREVPEVNATADAGSGTSTTSAVSGASTVTSTVSSTSSINNAVSSTSSTSSLCL